MDFDIVVERITWDGTGIGGAVFLRPVHGGGRNISLFLENHYLN